MKRYSFIQCLVTAILLLLPMLGLSQEQWLYSPTDVTAETEYNYHFYVSSEYHGQWATWASSNVYDITSGLHSQITDYGGIHATFKFNFPGSADLEVCVDNGGPCGYLLVYVHPMAPVVSSIAPVCGSGTVSITATYPGNLTSPEFRWYTSATGGSPIYTGATLQRSISATTTFYVATYASWGGESLSRTPVTAPVITNTMTAPAVTPAYGILGDQATLQASGAGSGVSYAWKNSLGTLIGMTTANTINVPVPPASMTNFVWVQFNDGVCEGPRAWIPITVYAKPVVKATGIAMGEATKLICDPGDYDTYTWYRNGSPVGSGNDYSTNIPGSYMVRVTKNGATGDSYLFTLGSQFEGENENYIVSEVMQVKGITDTSPIESLTRDKKSQAVQYFDGLGRPMQTVSTQGSPSGKDIVQPVVYDVYGREARKYLPVVPNTTDGWYKDGIIDANSGNYAGVASSNVYNNGVADKIDDDLKPYAETLLEASPLSRVLEQGMPGETWQPDPASTFAAPVAGDHSVKKAYEFNAGNEVILLNYDETTKRIGLGATNYYAANELQANKAKDEHNHEVIEYVDKDGHTILKKVETEVNGVKTFAETYYVYDDLGNLAIVLPPEAVTRLKTLLVP